jgi:hypothetical protein
VEVIYEASFFEYMALSRLPVGDGVPHGDRMNTLLNQVRSLLNTDPDRVTLGELDEAGKKLPVDSERFGLYIDRVFIANIIRIPDIDVSWGSFFDLHNLRIELRERLKGLKMDDVELR